MGDSVNQMQQAGIASLIEQRSQFIDTDSIEWEASEAEGFYYKILLQDQASDMRSWLMKIDPGGYSPLHSHDDIEQIYVLEGSFYDQDNVYGQGQYIVRSPGAEHTAGSETGAVVLLIYTPAVTS